MTGERKDEAPAGSAEEWPKRAPPTIDLDASDVSGDTRSARGLSAVRALLRRIAATAAGPGSRMGGVLPRLSSLLSGAVAALVVLAVVWATGLIGPPQLAQPAVSPVQFDNVAANVGALTARVARVEAGAARPAAPAADPALGGRTEALEKITRRDARGDRGRRCTGSRRDGVAERVAIDTARRCICHGA